MSLSLPQGDAPATEPQLAKDTRLGKSTYTKKDVAAALILLGLAVLVWLPRLHGPIDLRWDGGVYYVLGTSLAEGNGYRLLNEPGDIQATQYPPLLPAIIAAHQKVLGTSDPTVVGQALRITFFLAYVLYIPAIFLLARRYLPTAYAFCAALICLLHLHTFYLAEVCFPEILFGLTTVFFVLCSQNKNWRGSGFLAGLFAIAAYALRTIGIAVLVAWVAESVLKKQYKSAALRLALSLIPVICWQGYVSSVETGQEYKNPAYAYQRAEYLFYNVSYVRNVRLKEPFKPELGNASTGDIVRRFGGNLIQLPIHIGETVSALRGLWVELWRVLDRRLFPFLGPPWPVFVVLGLLGFLSLAGLGMLLSRREWLVPVYALLSLCAVCLTPWPEQFKRYLTPLAPFLAIGLLQSLLAIRQWSLKMVPVAGRRSAAALPIALVALIFVQQTVTLYWTHRKWHQEVAYTDLNGKKVAHRLFFYTSGNRVFNLGLDWLIAHAQPDSVIASSMPHWSYLRTGMKSVMPPFEPDPSRTQALLDTVPVRYLVLDEGLALDLRRYTTAVVKKYPGLWKRVYTETVTTEDGRVLKDQFQIYERVGSPKRVSTTDEQ